MSTATASELGLRGETTYARLPAIFHAQVAPTPVARPALVAFNRALAAELGLDVEVAAAAADVWAGSRVPAGATPLAQAYAGHQFGHFVRLGDGRAILLAEQVDPRGRRWDVQWKGSGPTPYSRRGDGRAALGPMLREYVISEAMHALGIPTTRSLAVARTGEPVFRERALPGAVLTRVAASHLRVGTFEFAAAIGDAALVRALADYAIARHYPAAAGAERPYLALFEAVQAAQADLIARWMAVGFVHGVMNTDNMSIAGETIDYGPCAFLEVHDPATVFSSIDEQGRYAYGNQPTIAQWNLARFAEALLGLIDPDPKQAVALAEAALGRFPAQFEARWTAHMRGKLGLVGEEEEDGQLARGLLVTMTSLRLDHTNTFRALADEAAPRWAEAPRWVEWRARWQARLDRQGEPWAAVAARIRAHNPAVIPRNHRVEEALAAAEVGDLGPFERLVAALSRPFERSPEHAEYAEPAPPGGPRYRTFCGT